jgi:mRNA interferase RelE/StbE
MHPIVFLPPAERYFKKIKEKGLKDAFLEAINQIREDPYSGAAKKGDLAGIYGYDLYYRGVNYEIAYRIVTNDDGSVVVVVMAGTRENFYEQLKNYLF